MLTLDVAIATHRPEGIKKVAEMLRSLPTEEGLRFVVSWQDHQDAIIPEELLQRNDTEVYRLNEKGVSNNRNNGLSHSDADLVLIADDDLIYEQDAFNKIREAFAARPQMEVGLFMVNYLVPKIYPSTEVDISLPFPKKYYGSAVEIAFRRERIGNLNFWSGIGPGNEFLKTGEDEFFLISMIRRGLKTKFLPIKIASHPALTTGKKVNDGILRGQGFLMAIMYPMSIFLRIPLKAYRTRKQSGYPFFKSLWYLSRGAYYSFKKLKSIPDKYCW